MKLVTHPDHPAEIIDGKCNALLWNCKGEECDYHYENPTDINCPLCSTPRRRCKGTPTKSGNGRCVYHNGNPLVGIAHPNYKGRGFSKNLPTKLLEYYEQSINNPDILVMDGDIALLEMRREDLMSRVGKDTNYSVWQKLREAYERLDKARRSGNKPGSVEKVAEALEEIENLILKGATDSAVWKEIYDVEERIRKFKVSEIKRRELAETVITEAQFRTLLGFIMNSIQTRVRDNDLKLQLLGDITSLQL